MVWNIFYFHPYLGEITILTSIFQMGWNHQPVDTIPNEFFCELTFQGFRLTLMVLAGLLDEDFSSQHLAEWWCVSGAKKNGVICLFSPGQKYTRWWFQIFFIFTPIWGNDPIWLIFFCGLKPPTSTRQGDSLWCGKNPTIRLFPINGGSRGWPWQGVSSSGKISWSRSIKLSWQEQSHQNNSSSGWKTAWPGIHRRESYNCSEDSTTHARGYRRCCSYGTCRKLETTTKSHNSILDRWPRRKRLRHLSQRHHSREGSSMGCGALPKFVGGRVSDCPCPLRSSNNIWQLHTGSL